eukprot:11612253-Prorocentrum_lima.AAC.1
MSLQHISDVIDASPLGENVVNLEAPTACGTMVGGHGGPASSSSMGMGANASDPWANWHAMTPED